MSGSRQIEMMWRCGRCGSENRGRDKVCASCGDPKDDSERFEMPGDTTAAPTVTDPELLRKATAGRDWACLRCGADVSALHEVCTQCGAHREAGERRLHRPLPGRKPSTGSVLKRFFVALAGASATSLILLSLVLFASFLCCCGLAVLGQPVDVATVVSRSHWEYTVVVDRYAKRAHEGFTEQMPAERNDVRSLGMRHHHNDRVVDHYETETYTVQVPDGVDHVPFTERVKCGETCTDLPERCNEKCSSNDNGFATCKTVCSGGGRKCTPKYCNEKRTREVPRTRPDIRTRQVPVYRDVPVTAEFFSWTCWEWAKEREVVATGDDGAPRWPSAEEIALGVGLAKGQQERERRSETYDVLLRAADGRTWPAPVKDAETFARFPMGSAHIVRTQGDKVSIDPPTPGSPRRVARVLPLDR